MHLNVHVCVCVCEGGGGLNNLRCGDTSCILLDRKYNPQNIKHDILNLSLKSE